MVTFALNYGEIELHLERVSNIKLFVIKCHWKGINYLSKVDDCITFEKNNPTIVLYARLISQKLIRIGNNKYFY